VGVLKQPWAITAAAALVVLDHHTRFVTVAIAFLLFTAVSTASVALIYVYYARRPGQAQARLEELRAHLTRAGPTIFAAIAIVGGVVVALDGVIGLTSD
jgi:Sap, sulfolipid-1-addressing protein